MSSLQATNLGDNYATTGRDVSRTKGNVDAEDSEMNLFLSDESNGNDHEREMDETSGETSGETSNGSNSDNSKKSNSSVSTTEVWFREFNQNTIELNVRNFDDDDSETPYYVNSYKSHHPEPVSNKQSSIASRHHHQHSQRTGYLAHGHRVPPNCNVSKSPRRENLHKKHKKREESSGSDSYRSVIDDLTLKNQKLRQKLRKLERIHAKSLHKEKLFEVRYYQMPRKKRHELEEYLRQFAAQLSTPNSSSTQSTQNSTNTNGSSTGNIVDPSPPHIKANDKSKMKQVVRAIENVFTTELPVDDHYLKDQEEADPQGYVYLNLLTNMAQLHTMNVTLSLVKQAIRTFSNCLELNEDGTKVRWRTGLDHIKSDQFSTINDNKVKDAVTIGSGESSGNTSSGLSEIRSTGDKQSDFSPSNPFAESVQASSDQKNSANAYITPSLTSSFTSKPINQQSSISHYRPVFLHRNVSSSLSSSDETSSETDQNDGPVIYYEGGLFCTDLSRNVIMDDDDDKPSPSGTCPSQSSTELDNLIAEDHKIHSRKKWNVPRYERATNSILGGNDIISNETSEDNCSEQEADDESLTKLCVRCDANDNDLLICSHTSADNPKLSVIAVDDRNENSMDANDVINKILMEKDIEFTHRTQSNSLSSTKNYDEINDWNENVSKNSSSSPFTNNSNQYLPEHKKLYTTKVPGITTEDNFMVLVQTSHPMREKISRSVDDDTLMNVSNNNSIHMEHQRNEKSQQGSESHKIVSTKFFQLPPSMSPQLKTSSSGVRRTSLTSKTSSSDSGGSSGYGSSSSYSNTFSESSSAASRDNSYLLRNSSTLLQLSQTNNNNRRNLNDDDEIQDMELDSLSSDSSDLSPFINIDTDEDEETEIKKNNISHHHRIEESKLGMDLRLQDAAVEERRKFVDKIAPQEQNFRLLKDIMASSRAVIEALEDNKSDNDIGGGMDSLSTIPLPFLNQQFNFLQQQSNLGINNLSINGINQNNNNNNNNNS